MDQDEIKKHVQEIEKIYVDFHKRLLEVKREQDKIIADFEEVLRSERLKDVKKSLGII